MAGVLKYENYIECTNNMATFNGCNRILKADVCLVKLYLKTMDNQLSNYSVTSIKSRHIVCALNIFLFFLTPAIFSNHNIKI